MGDNCPPEQRNNDAALTAAVTEVLQMWLRPLRDYTQKSIVNDFRYQRIDIANWKNAPDPSIIFRPADLGIVFHCDLGASFAHMGRLHFDETSYLEMHEGTQVTKVFISGLAHEMGHALGLADTYAREDRGELGLSKGGLDATRGTQPNSIMALLSNHRGGELLGKDDKNGIIWLYKHIYENQPFEDCFFTDYELENTPRGCVPKCPLIFEIKWVSEIGAIFVIRDDENINVNVQDEDGMTALHHTVLNEYARLLEALIKRDDIKLNTQATDGMTVLHYAVLQELDEVVKELLAHEDIIPFLRDRHGRSALQIARENKLDRMITLLLAHPLTLPVDPKGKLTTTWGHLKKRY